MPLCFTNSSVERRTMLAGIVACVTLAAAPAVADPAADLARQNAAVQAAMAAGQWAEADQTAARAAQLAADHNLDESVPGSRAWGLACQVAVVRGNLPEAEKRCPHAVAALEACGGPNDGGLAWPLAGMAEILRLRGDLQKAAELLDRALKIADATFGARSEAHIDVLAGLAAVEMDRGHTGQAVQFLLRAQAIAAQLDPPKPAVQARVHQALGAAWLAAGKPDVAEPLLKAAASAQRQAPSQRSPSVELLVLLGQTAAARGQWPQAVELFRQAYALRKAALGPLHAETGAVAEMLVRAQLAAGDYRDVLVPATDAEAALENALGHVIGGKHAARLAYWQTQRAHRDLLVSLWAQHQRNDNRALDLALTAVLRRQGRALEAAYDHRSHLRRHFPADAQPLFDQITATQAALVERAIESVQFMPVFAPPAADRLDAKLEPLQASLSYKMPAADQRPPTLQTVVRGLPVGAVLIQYAAYRPFGGGQFAAAHLAAFVVRKHEGGHTIDGVELGPLQPIAEQAAMLKSAVQRPNDPNFGPAARQLDALVFEPLRPYLGPSKFLLVAPDEPLEGVPFAALVDAGGHFAVETYTISYLTSGRQLAAMRQRLPAQSGPLVAADPEFVSADVPPLPASAAEGRLVAALLPKAKLLLGDAANESALKAVPGPEVLHLATRCYLHAPDAAISPPPSLISDGWLRPSRSDDNPLLRAKLATGQAVGDDGWLTALDVAGIDLFGTRMLVLPPCQMAADARQAAEPANLWRGAGAMAGAESVVLPLWPVNDEAARTLLGGLYARLKQGEFRVQALRNAQLAMLRGPAPPPAGSASAAAPAPAPDPAPAPVAAPAPARALAHPYFWAAYTLSGDWRALQ